MYAIIRTGGKQYRVEPGETVCVEKLAADQGASVKIDDVLLVSNEGDVRVGNPCLSGVSVLGTIVDQGRGRKIRVFKYKHRKHYRRTRGHRQSYTALRIDSIEA
ncbi:MAG: 50S ribosomal protein L21 [Vicinamibacteria bacterium]|nr:50S ribosomal protein L21 [Vicinamibacteria bacterium]